MVRQHDAAGADADGGCRRCDVLNQDLGRGAGDVRHAVMLGKPEPHVAEPLTQLREVNRIAQRVTRGRAFADRRQIEN